MKIPKFALPHRVTIVPFLGSGAYGPQWETDELKFKKKVHCLIEPKTRMIKTTSGQDVLQQAQAIFHPDNPIQIGDKILWTKYGLEFEVQEWFPVEAMGLHSFEAVLS